MHSSKRFTLLLLCLVIGLAGWLVITPERDKAALAVLPAALRAEHIQEIFIERSAGEDLHLAKQNGRWELRAPLRLAANPARIHAILRVLDTPSLAQLKTRELELSVLGLARPDTVLHLNGHRLAFGGTAALDGRRYLMFAGRVHLIEDGLYHLLRQGPLFFADPKLLADEFQITAIDHPHYRLHRERDWQLTTGQEARAGAAERLLHAWRTARAAHLRPYVPRAGLGRITVKTAGGQTLTFFIMAREPALILARPALGIEYHLDSDTSKTLSLPEQPTQSKEKTALATPVRASGK